MSEADEKQALRRYLLQAREALLWKLEGLSDYDIRRPMTPTGTNLLGLVKHAGGPATEAESREQVTGFYRRGWAHSDAIIEELPLDARVTVAWWPEGLTDPTLATLLVHMIQETARHAGHADIIRESIDGAVGEGERSGDLPAEADAAGWKRHHDRLERIARSAGNQPAR